ncbi:hypothetical protein BX070DRAFT_251065 [Coemansia spiralis]|nr:hypothetical protein BX070DRAFT_251065 [Coemansia spiralis]
MEVQLEPLLKYAEELLQSYSRIIVYSGDILRSLPEPREGLSAANVKPKKEESTAFLREWQHLESVFDEYLIRLNDIRTRAHEELEAARVRCLVGEDVDLSLPEAVFKLKTRLAKYKKQYTGLLKIAGGGSVKELEGFVESLVCEEVKLGENENKTKPSDNQDDSAITDPAPPMQGSIFDSADTGTQDTTEATTETPGIMVVDDDYDNIDDQDQQTGAGANENNTAMDINTPVSVRDASESRSAPAAGGVDGVEAMEVSDTPAPEASNLDVEAGSLFDVDNPEHQEAIVLDSNSDLDDEEMEDMFE